MAWVEVPFWMKMESDMPLSVLLKEENCEEDIRAVVTVTLLWTWKAIEFEAAAASMATDSK